MSEASFALVDLHDDLLGELARLLSDPLRPLLTVHLGSTAKGLKVPMQAALAELKQMHDDAAELAALCNKDLAWLAARAGVFLGAQNQRPLSLAHWTTLGTLAGCRSLQSLRWLSIEGSEDSDEGVTLLADGIHRGGLPCLSHLSLETAHIGPAGASALATALNKRALPSLEILSLENNQIADDGLAALAPALRQLPNLQQLYLTKNHISDKGVASLLAPPLCECVLASLEFLYINGNRVGNEGCAALAHAIHIEDLPALNELLVYDNPASLQAQQAVADALRERAAARSPK